jgi:hypothetical protein
MAVTSPSGSPVCWPVAVLRAVGSPSVMKTTRSATGLCVLASRTFWKAASQLVYPLGLYPLTR